MTLFISTIFPTFTRTFFGRSRQNIFLIILVFQTPVENGNGLAAEHSEKSEEVAASAASESAAKRPLAETEPEEAGSEAKRICSNPTEAEEAQADIVAEAPNGVNSTPHPITSGGD